MIWLIILTILVLLLGLAVLAISTNYLSTALVKLSDIIGIPTAVVGAIILALGTSLPELTNGIISATKGLAELGLGNIVGSVIANTALTMGILHFVGTSEKIDVKASKRLLLTILLTAALLFIFASNDFLGRLEGITILGIFLVYSYFTTKHGFASLHSEFSTKRLIVPYLLVPLSLFSLMIGAFLVVSTTSSLARLAGVSASTIGLTLVALGTTTPELIAGLFAAKNHHKNLAIGSALGGAAMVTLLVLGLVSTIFTIKLTFSSFIIPILFLIAVAAANLAYISKYDKTNRMFGLTLMAGYLIYLLLVI